MDQYNEAMDKIGEAIIGWADATGKWTADREVSVHVSPPSGMFCVYTMMECVLCAISSEEINVFVRGDVVEIEVSSVKLME